MKRVFFLILFLLSVTIAQDEVKPWEKLGLSQTEWKMIKDAGMSIKKVESLLKDGIGIEEYLSKPWENYGLTESEWIKKRRSGMTNYDIQLESSIQNDGLGPDTKNGIRSDFSSMSGNGQMVSSLFLPGYQQIRAGKKNRGILMVSLAGGAVVWCAADAIANKRFFALPVCVLALDMIWSFVDFKVSSKK